MTMPKQTRWSQDRKAEKCCTSCGKPLRTYTSLCDPCMSKQRNRMRVRRVRQVLITGTLCLAYFPTCNARLPPNLEASRGKSLFGFRKFLRSTIRNPR